MHVDRLGEGAGVLHDQLGVPFLQFFFGRCCWKVGMWQPYVSYRLELLCCRFSWRKMAACMGYVDCYLKRKVLLLCCVDKRLNGPIVRPLNGLHSVYAKWAVETSFSGLYEELLKGCLRIF